MSVIDLVQGVAGRFAMVFDAYLYFWQYSVPVVVAALVAIATDWPGGDEQRRIRPWLLWAFPLLVSTWGVLFEHTDMTSAAPAWPSYGIGALLLLQLLTTAVLVVRLRGRRWYAAGVGLLAGFFGLGAAVFGVMSVTGQWL